MNYSTLLRRSVDFDTYANGDIEGAAAPDRSLPGTTRTSSSARSSFADAAAVGPRRGQRLRPAHDQRPAPGTPSTRCCCRSRSATTRSPTSPPRPRRAPSARCTYRPAHVRRPLTRREAALRHPDVRATPPCDAGSGIVVLRHRPAAHGERRQRGNPRTADRQPPAAGGQRPPQRAPQRSRRGVQQKSDFLKTGGGLVDVCTPLPCFAAGFTGP